MKRFLLLLALCSAGLAQAAPWSYRGTLSDGGRPANGLYDLRLTLRDASGRITIAPPVALRAVAVREGVFETEVDLDLDMSSGPLSLLTEVSTGDDQWVQLGEPVAFDPKAALGTSCWGTAGNSATNPASEFLGTTDAQPLVLRVNNIQAVRLQPSGSEVNWIAGAAASSPDTAAGLTIAGGSTNAAWGSFSTVGGGVLNTVGTSSAVPGAQLAGTVSGGAQNLARGSYATVSGGQQNTAERSWASALGGFGNRAFGAYATTSGGFENCAGGLLSWAGGFRAVVRAANGGDACPNVAGNSGDSDGDEGSFVWGDALGPLTTTTGPNQFLVRAAGGVGINTNALNPGDDLVLSPRPAPADADADLRMMSRSGKAALTFLSDTSGTLQINLIGLTAGSDRLRVNANSSTASLSGGGTWTNASSRDYKHAFAPVDPLDVLSKVLALPLSSWEYRESAEGRHLGPMAEDFKASFGLAGDGRSIATVDADGVALAAIQGLNAKLEAENSALRAETRELKARLEALESLLLPPAAAQAASDR